MTVEKPDAHGIDRPAGWRERDFLRELAESAATGAGSGEHYDGSTKGDGYGLDPESANQGVERTRRRRRRED